MDQKIIGYEDVDWIHLARDRDHRHHRIEPSGFRIFLTSSQDRMWDVRTFEKGLVRRAGIGEKTKWRNGKFHELHYSQNIIKMLNQGE